MRHDITSSSDPLFSQRKVDHIEISMQPESQSLSDQFSRLLFQHNAIPEINFDEIDLSCDVFDHSLKSPLFVSSMTLGHEGAEKINHQIMGLCEKKGWMMGVGSQRRQLFDPKAWQECQTLRQKFPQAILFGNIGLSQLITSSINQMEELVASLGAQFLVIHTNPLQEAMQPEGTPQFKGGLEALKNLCQQLSVPVVLKETGCGFSKSTFEKLADVGLSAIDVSGRGGTHWGRVEGLRQELSSQSFKVAQTFANWGLTTVESLENGVEASLNTQLWASGGVRSGLDAAKLLALGAHKVGFAQPILKSALKGPIELEATMTQLEQELKVAMFCLGLDNVESLVGKRNLLKWT